MTSLSSSPDTLTRIDETLDRHGVDSVDAPGYREAMLELDDLLGQNIGERQEAMRELYMHVQQRSADAEQASSVEQETSVADDAERTDQVAA